MTVSMQKTLAALKLPTSVPALLSVAGRVVDAMTGNPSFPGPTPSLADVVAARAAQSDAEAFARTRTVGAAAERNHRRKVLVGLLMALKAHVQIVADADPDHAATLIESAGMQVKRATTRSKPPFEVTAGRVSGSVRMVARSAGDRAQYAWAWSTDAGATWKQLPSTLQARTELAGLVPGSTSWFRYRVLTRTGVSDWSEPFAFVVR